MKIPMNRRVFIWRNIFLLMHLMSVASFHRDIPLKSSSSQKANNPLSTAGTVDATSTSTVGLRSYIPRLEPGLRLRRSIYSTSTYGSQYEAVRITTFSLDMLKNFDYVEDTVSADDAASAANTPAEGAASSSFFVYKINQQIGQILRDAYAKLAQATEIFKGYMKKVVRASAIIAAALSSALAEAMPSSMNLRRFSAAGSSVLTAVTIGGSKVAYASSAFKKYEDLTAAQRLATTPLFYVSNSRGNSFLQDDVQAGKPEQKIIVYFMSSEDAADYMNELAQGNAAMANEFRITTVSMEKVFSQIQSRKQSRKLGRYKMDTIHRIQPSSKQSLNAEIVAGDGNRATGVKKLEGVSIPMFTAPGMAIKRENGEVVTPYYFALEDLKEDWSRMALASTSAAIAKDPKVVVSDFTDVMQLAEGISAYDLFPEKVPKTRNAVIGDAKKVALNPGIVPPRREIEMIRSYYRNEAGSKNEFMKSRLMGRSG